MSEARSHLNGFMQAVGARHALPAWSTSHWTTIAFALLFSVLLLAVLPAAAQDTTVTDDEVNAVAKQLYCPVCENIPLDVCPTEACAMWREDIREQLQEGLTPQQVIDTFVVRFGDRVVGTPQDPTLHALSVVTPFLVAIVALVVGMNVLLRRRRKSALIPVAPVIATARDDEYYRARLEADLQARR